MNMPHGSEPLLSAKLIRDMRAHIDDVPLSPNQRQAVETGISRVEKHWVQRKQDHYASMIEHRDSQHAEVVNVAQASRKTAEGVLDRIAHGRMTAQEGRAWLRDVLGYHTQLVQQHEAIKTTEDSLAEFDALPPADYQAQQFERFPSDRQSGPSLAQEVADYQTEMRRKSFQRNNDMGPMGLDAHPATGDDEREVWNG